MGAWGPHPFDNDDAVDWRYQLLDGGGVEVVASALAEPADDAESAARAVAAAALVGAALGADPVVPDDMKEWLAQQDASALAALAPAAVAALDRILTASELEELWAEGGSDDWHAAVHALRDETDRWLRRAR
jgi:hypothetical protein